MLLLLNNNINLLLLNIYLLLLNNNINLLLLNNDINLLLLNNNMYHLLLNNNHPPTVMSWLILHTFRLLIQILRPEDFMHKVLMVLIG